MPEETATPAPIAAATAATFGLLSRLRGARIFHPDGVGYSGSLIVDRQAAHRGPALFQGTAEYPALFRFSRAAGLPERLPDALGLTVRLVDVHGPGRHQDFLLVTSADGPLLHHLLLPAVGGFFGQSFSSLLLYRVGRDLRVVGATPTAGLKHRRGDPSVAELTRIAARGELSFDLTLASPFGRWETVGTLRVGKRLPDHEADDLAFTPWNTGGGIRPVGPLMGLRRAAYRGSHAGRGLHDDQIP